MKQRMISVLLAVVMVFTSADLTALAKEPVMGEESTILTEQEEADEETPEKEEPEESTSDGETDDPDKETSEPSEEEGKDEESSEPSEEEGKDEETTEPDENLEKEALSENDVAEEDEEETESDSEEPIRSFGADHCGDAALWKWEEDSLVISGSGEMWDYKETKRTPWADRSEAYTLVIKEGITHIGAFSFAGCTGLTGDIALPEGVASVGAGAFSGCTGVSGKVYIPESVNEIGENAFPASVFCEIYGVEGSYAETYAAQAGIRFVPKLLFCDEEELQLLEGQIAQVDKEVYAASNINTDDFQERYGLTYEDLLFRCPEYLENGTMEQYLDKKFLYAGEVWGDAMVEEKTAKWMYNLKQGMSYNVKVMLGDIGVTESEHEKFQLEMAKQVVKDYLSTDTSSSGMFKEVADNLSVIDKVYDVVDKNQEYVAEMAKGCKKLSQSEIAEMTKAIKDAKPVMEYVNDLETMFKLSSAVIAMEELDLQAVDFLIESQEIQTKDNDIYEGLCLLREQLKKDPAAYVLTNYCTDKIIAELASSLEGVAAEAMFGAGSYTVIRVLAKGVAGVYELFNPSYEEMQYATICFSYYTSASNCVRAWQKKFKRSSRIDARNEILYEAAYQLRISCLRAFLKNATGCTRDKNKIRTLNTYCGYISDYDMYSLYINLCMQEASAALKNGTLELKDVEVIRKTGDGTVIDENYSSKESITARFAAIQAQYVPNVGQTWTDSWEGAVQCFGFARMVFSKLFGCSMPYQYYGSARYAYAQETNVTLVGQVVGSDVTADSVKNLFQQGSLGDVVQGYGSPYGQHTSVLAGVTDSGATLYYCNQTGECGIYQTQYTWSQLASRYGTGDDTSENGISLYHASNYATIYGDGSDLFYDDSVNFVIQDGVLTKYNGWQKLVKIPDTVTAIGKEAFKNNTTMISVDIPGTVTSIGDSAFYGCTALLGVIIPDSVQSVGSSCFYGCTKLAYAQLPDGQLIAISAKMFYGCYSLQNIQIPDTVINIYDGAFYRCTNMRQAILSENLSGIGSTAFYECKSLVMVDFPKSLTNISYSAFYGCNNLKEIKLPSQLKEIGVSAFANCKAAESIYIPKSLQQVNDVISGAYVCSVFEGCSSVKKIEFEEGISKIPKSLFKRCEWLKSISIPDSVTSIGSEAFWHCEQLETVQFSSGLLFIGSGAFSGCSKLKEMDLPACLTEISSSAFYGCSSLKEIKLPSKLKEIGVSAFANCKAAESIYVPKSLQQVNDVISGAYVCSVFEGCSSVKKIEFEEGISKIPKSLFKRCEWLKSISIPDSVTSIESKAFYECGALETICFENSDNINTISDEAFRGTAITEINIPSTAYFGNYVFADCSNLDTAYLPKTWIRLMQGTFYNCKELKTVVLPEKLQELRQEAFRGCVNLQAIDFPDTLCTIGNSAFYNCDSLTGLTIPDSVTSMGASAFCHCDNLKDVSLGTGLTTIPQYAFANCGKIEEITLPYRMTKIDQYAFNADTSLTKIMIPRNVSSIATNAFSYPDKMTIYGVTGTYAETFANTNGYSFVSNEIPATEMKVTPEEMTVNSGQWKRLSLQVTPANFTDKVTFKSANTAVATVNADGKVSGVSVGNTTIKVIVGNLSKSIKVQVNQPVTGIYVYPGSQEMEAGEELKLEVSVYPDDATNKEYELVSSDSTVASVTADGTVKALKKGDAKITAKALDGSGESGYSLITVVSNLYPVQGTEGFESAHPYEDNCKDLWEYTNPEAQKIKVTFSKETEVEEGFDYLKIYGKDQKLVGTYTGTELAGKSVEVEGNTIRVRLLSDDGGSAYGFKVTELKVNGQEIPLKAIGIEQTELQLAKGEQQTLKVIYTPENTTTDKTVVWSSSDEKIVTVDENGTVTAVSAGTAKITAKVGRLTASATVTVTAAMKGIAFARTELTLLRGDSYALPAAPIPEDTTDDRRILYQSSDEEVVSVDAAGTLFAKKKGTAVITAASVYDSAFTAACVVTVTCSTVTFDSRGGSVIDPIECSAGEGLDLSERTPEREGYLFTGWYKDEQCTQLWKDAEDRVEGDLTLYAGWEEIKEDFWVVSIPEQGYTGAAVKPQVTAYDGRVKLTPGKDYSVSYKNNVNVYGGTDEKKKPQIIVKGLGNYSGTKIITFTILPKDLADEDITIADLYRVVNGREQKALPTVLWGKKKLTYNKTAAKSNYTLIYPEGDYSKAGEHEITVVGRGNYCGTKSFHLILTDKKLLAKASVKYAKSMPYRDGMSVEQEDVTVKLGGKALVQDVDYTVAYENNTQIGTAYMILKGKGDYSGEKRVAYAITGQKLSKAKITGISNQEYSGEPVYQQYSIVCDGDSLVLHRDYEVTYQKNTAVGTATMLFRGIGGYTGTVKKTFRITPYSLKNNSVGYFEEQSGDIQVSYEKSGAKPSVQLTFRGMKLEEGRDYTLTYQNNKAVHDGQGEKKVPKIVIKGKGNFKDSVTRSFAITTADVGGAGNRMQAVDVVYKNKAGAYKTKPVIYDCRGKKLTAGTDYAKALIFRYDNAQGEKIGEKDILPAGSVVYVEAQGIKNYEGSSIGTTYRVVAASIKSAKVTVKAQRYTGSPVRITKDDIESIKLGKDFLTDSDYEILEDTYINNVKKGTAKVTIRGCGEYGGEKQITFKITAKRID